MAGGKYKESEYDDEVLVMLLAKGEKTHAQIAEEVGLSAVFVGQISRGERRPELQKRIEEICEGMLDQARRLGKRLASVAMGRLGSLVAKDSEAGPDVQRKASVDILNQAIGDPSKTQINMNQSMPGLSLEELERVTKMKGGPE
ncbi:MAG: hypothetical protein KAV00_07150 [Phycisphaerae bacterium]|nr:hypothetical protein [Phycisphaerae bacterium]